MARFSGLSILWLGEITTILLRVASANSATCIRRSVLYYTSQDSTYTLSELATSTVSSCSAPVIAAPYTTTVYFASNASLSNTCTNAVVNNTFLATTTIPPTTIYITQSALVPSGSDQSPTASATNVIPDGSFEQPDASPQQSSSDANAVTGQVTQEIPLTPYSGDSYFLITFNATAAGSKVRRQQTAATASQEFNLTQTFATSGGVSYTVGAIAEYAPVDGSTPACSLVICVDEACGGSNALTQAWEAYTFVTTPLAAGNATAVFRFSCIGSAYVGVDDVSAVANGAQGTSTGSGSISSAAIPPGTRTLTLTASASVQTTTIFATQTQYLTLEPSDFPSMSSAMNQTALRASTVTQTVTETVSASIASLQESLSALGSTVSLPPTSSAVSLEYMTTTIISVYNITYTTSILGSTQYLTSVVQTTLFSDVPITYTTALPASTQYATSTIVSSLPVTYTTILAASTLIQTEVATTTIVSSYPVTYTLSQPAQTLYETSYLTTVLFTSYGITYTSLEQAQTAYDTQTLTTTLLSSYPVVYTTTLDGSIVVSTEYVTATTFSSYGVTGTITTTLPSSYAITYTSIEPASTLVQTELATTTLLSSYEVTYTSVEPPSTLFETTLLTTTLLSSYPVTETLVSSYALTTTLVSSYVVTTTLISSFPITTTLVSSYPVTTTLVSSYPITTTLPANTLTQTGTETTTEPTSYPVTYTTSFPGPTEYSTIYVSINQTIVQTVTEDITTFISASATSSSLSTQPTINLARYIVMQNQCAGRWAQREDEQGHPTDYIEPGGALAVGADPQGDSFAFTLVDYTLICANSTKKGALGCQGRIYDYDNGWTAGDVITLYCLGVAPIAPPASSNTITMRTTDCGDVVITISGNGYSSTVPYQNNPFDFSAPPGSTVNIGVSGGPSARSGNGGSYEAVLTDGAGNKVVMPYGGFQYTPNQDAQQNLSVVCYPGTGYGIDCNCNGASFVATDQSVDGIVLSSSRYGCGPDTGYINTYPAYDHTILINITDNTGLGRPISILNGDDRSATPAVIAQGNGSFQYQYVQTFDNTDDLIVQCPYQPLVFFTTTGCPAVLVTMNNQQTQYNQPSFTVASSASTVLSLLGGPNQVFEVIWLPPGGTPTAQGANNYYSYTVTSDAQQTLSATCYPAQYFQMGIRCENIVASVTDLTHGIELTSTSQSPDYQFRGGLNTYVANDHMIQISVTASSSSQSIKLLHGENGSLPPYATGTGSLIYQFTVSGYANYYLDCT